MLSQTSEHAIRALLYLAQRPTGEAVPAERIARALGAPANYLAKTLNALARHGLVTGTRGPTGGFCLRVPASDITLARVVEAFGELRPQAMCMLGDRPCSALTPCAAHVRWAQVQGAIHAPLRTTSIADLLDDSPREGLHAAGMDAGTHGPAAVAA
ncbi:Rrf2 family transcriptional regulator [Longimicrobium sp.]|uniref:RrF2 family transcriptional regulator n=1 Tax=Longimicrobium sp. TaxID=2029185 RepID=UPI002E371FC4|nr:Rrf2 family transcriptional regulator [Longimicrobium sp.]HEX6037029.1 Rrf2 family transcriptional regulator [Longimicrobium sp.]